MRSQSACVRSHECFCAPASGTNSSPSSQRLHSCRKRLENATAGGERPISPELPSGLVYREKRPPDFVCAWLPGQLQEQATKTPSITATTQHECSSCGTRTPGSSPHPDHRWPCHSGARNQAFRHLFEPRVAMSRPAPLGQNCSTRAPWSRRRMACCAQ